MNDYRDTDIKPNTELDLGLVIYIIRKSVWFIVTFFLISVGLAFIYLRYSQPIFQSTSVIQINDNSRATDILQLSKTDQSSNQIAEAIEQIRSKIFLKRVVEKSDIQISYYNEGTFKNNELYKSSPYFVKFNIKKNNIYGVKIYIQFKNPGAGVLNFVVDGKNYSIPFSTNNVVNSPFFDLSIYLNKELDPSTLQTLILDNNKDYFVIKNVNDVTDELQSKLDVKLLSDEAKTIIVIVKDVNAAKSKDLVNLISQEYLVFDVERKSESSKSIITFIDEQLNMVYEELKVSESNLQNFRKNKNYTDKDEIVNANLLRLTNLEDEILKVELEEKLLSELQANITKNKSIDTYQLISLIAGTEYENAIKEYTQNIQKLLIEKENLLYQLTPSSENIKQINFNIETQKILLIETLNSVRLKYKAKLTSLTQKSSEFKSKYQKAPDEDMEHARLMRLFSISEKYYTMLLERKTEFSISKAGFVSQNVILEMANNNGELVSPNRKNSIIVAMLSAALLSLLLVLVRYFLHNTITSVNDITKNAKSSVSILGVVPNYESDIPVSQLVVDKNPKSQIAEAFRSIRSNLQFIKNTPGPKIIAITSSISGEGKTFVSLNIAGILAYTGKRVVLLDLDMRKPKIHKGFGVENNKGMSTILNCMTTIAECINKSNFNNLDYITAGPIPPNPAELIISNKLDEMIEELKQTYDYIVFDNPPIGLVTDGITTIQKADYPIYVFRSSYSKKSSVQILDKLVQDSRIKNISVILNGIDLKRFGYGYNYGYSYDHGYYADEQEQKTNHFSKLWK